MSKTPTKLNPSQMNSYDKRTLITGLKNYEDNDESVYLDED